MSFFGPLVLWSWLPVVLMIFSSRPVRDAIVFSFVFAWLFLPNIGFDIPVLPNYTKMSATVSGVILSVLLFDSQQIMAFRPKWYDFWAFVLCGCRLGSSIVNNQGAWDGCSAMLDQMFAWGCPYFIGRIYLSDLEGARKLCLGMVIGALVYVPFCLVEIRLSPQFDRWVYAINRWEGYRAGGFRPRVFLATGLELGMWMSNATFLAWILTLSGSVKVLSGYSFRMLTIGLSVVNVFCRSTGALGLLIVGLALAWLVHLTKQSWPVWLLILLPAGYVVARSSGTWSGADAVEISKALVGEERAQSLEYRFQCEEVLYTYTSRRPLFGYSRNGGFNQSAATGKQDVVVDGYYIIIFGEAGLLGLVSFIALMIQPMILVLRRFPIKTWNEPDVAPVIGLAWILLLFMADCLSNAMINPIYAVVSGALMGLKATGRGGVGRLAEFSLSKAHEHLSAGQLHEAEHEFLRAVEQASGPGQGLEEQAIRAAALEGLGRAYRQTDQLDDSELAIREAIEDRLALASEQHDPERLRDLAVAHEALARTLSDLFRHAEAIEQRRRALEFWASLAADDPDDPEVREHRAASLNDLAWLLVAEANPEFRDPAEAAELALEAVRHDPENVAPWNTLGVARYRIGDWAGSVEALEHSVAIGRNGGTAFDHYILAMAYHKLGQLDLARDRLARATAWADQHRPGHSGLASFRAEAEAMIVQESLPWRPET